MVSAPSKKPRLIRLYRPAFPLYGMAVEIFQELARDKELTDYRLPADLARDAMIKRKEEIRKEQGNCSATELLDFLHSHEQQSELMIAYYFNGKPYIYTVDLIVCRSDRELSHYSAIGCGANLGGYLLKEHAGPEMNIFTAPIIAAYVVEIVKQNDTYCGGPTRIGTIINGITDFSVPTPPEAMEKIPKEEVDFFQQEYNKFLESEGWVNERVQIYPAAEVAKLVELVEKLDKSMKGQCSGFLAKELDPLIKDLARRSWDAGGEAMREFKKTSNNPKQKPFSESAKES